MSDSSLLEVNYVICTRFIDGMIRIRLDLNHYGTYTSFKAHRTSETANWSILDIILDDCNRRGFNLRGIVNGIDFVMGTINVLMVRNIPLLEGLRYLDIYSDCSVAADCFIYSKLSDAMKVFIGCFVPYITSLCRPQPAPVMMYYY